MPEDKLEITMSIDLDSLDKWLKEAEKKLTDFWKKVEKNNKIKITADTSSLTKDVKKTNKEIQEINKETMDKAGKGVASYVWIAKNEINRVKKEFVSLWKTIDTEMKIDYSHFSLERFKKELYDSKIIIKDTWKEMTKLQKDVVFKLTVEKAEAQKKIDAFSKDMKELQRSKKIDIDVKIDKTVSDIDKLKKELKTVDKEADKVRFDKITADIKIAENKLQTFKKKLSEIKNTKVVLDFKTDQAKRELKEVTRWLNNMYKTWDSMVGRFWKSFNTLWNSIKAWLFSTFWALSLWWALYKWISATTALMEDSKRVAIEWESAFVWVQKTINWTSHEFKILKKELIDLTSEIPLTFKEISTIAELWWQMWVPIWQIKEYTKAVAMIWTTTNLSIEESATQFARLHNILQLPLDQIDKTASAIVDLWNNFAAQEDEILNFTMRIAWAGKVSEMSVGALTGISTAFTSVWIKAEMWWSAVSKAMLKMSWAVNEWWAALEWFAKTSWMSAEDFKVLRGQNSKEAFVRFVEWLKKAGKKADWIITQLLWNNIRTKQSFLNLANAWDLLRNSVETWTKAFAENSAMLIEAEKRYASTESQMKLVSNEFEEQQAILWEKLIPAYFSLEKIKLAVMKWFIKFVERLDKFNIWLKAIIPTLSLLWVTLAFVLWWPVLASIAAGLMGITAIIWYIWAESEKTATKLDELRWEMKKLWEESDKLKDKENKLIDEFVNWKISAEKYRAEMEKLNKEKEKNRIESEKITGQYRKEVIYQEKITWLKKDEEKQIKKVNELKLKQIRLEKEYTQRKSELYAQRERNIDAWLSEIEADKIYWEWINRLDIELNKHRQTLEENIKKSEQLTKRKNDEKLARDIAKNATKNDIDMKKIFNKLKLDTSWNVKNLNKETNANLELIASYREAIRLRMLDASSKYQEIATEWPWNKWLIDSWTWWKKALSEYNNKLTEANNKYKALADIYKELKDYKWYEPVEIIKTWEDKKIEASVDWLKEVSKTRKQQEQQLKDINELLSDWNLTEEQREDLLETQTKLNKELEKSTAWWVKTARQKVDLKKQELALLERQYQKELQFIDEVYWEDLNSAYKIMKAKENYEQKKRDIEWKTHEIIIKNAEELIEKQRELQEQSQSAFDDLLSNVQDTASELWDLWKEISNVNNEISNIKTDAINDVKDRYKEIVDEIEDVNITIQDLESKTTNATDSTKDLQTEWKNVSDQIKESDKSIANYEKSIDWINEKMSKLDTDTTWKLADRYVKLWEEIDSNQDKLDELNAKTTLTTQETEQKLKLEEAINKALQEQALAKTQISDVDIQKSENKAEETTTEKLIRERDEKLAIYQQDLIDLQNKLTQEQQIKSDLATKEQGLRKQLDEIEVAENKAKLDKLQKQLEDAYAKREDLIREKAQAENFLTNQQIKDALNKETETKVEAILNQRQIDLKAKETELNDLKKANADKLEEYKKYLLEVVKMKQLAKKEWVNLSSDKLDVEQAKKDLSNADYNWSWNLWLKEAYKEDRISQEKATNKLITLWRLLDKLVETNKWDNEKMLKLLKKVTELRNEANLSQVIDQKTINSINQANTINAYNWLDMESITRMLRNSLKI